MSSKELIQSHIETHIGNISSYAHIEDQKDFSIACIPQQPGLGTTTYVSIGLYKHWKTQTETEVLSHEFVFPVYNHQANDTFIKFLITLCQEIIKNKQNIPLGAVIDFERPLITGATVQSTWFYLPLFYQAELAVLESKVSPITFQQVYPLIPSELSLLLDEGGEALDRYMEINNPDILDLNRLE